MSIALSVEELRKKYGMLEAVKGISFEVNAGEIFALIGPNGAGKTSTLRMIATILKPSSGDARIYGTSISSEPEKVRQIISYLPEEAGAYKNMTGKSYLHFMASLFAPDKNTQKEYVEKAYEITGLGDRLSDKIGTYSKGMTRKILLARAVMTRPRLAILDEPTSGLDVINALEIRKTIKALAGSGMSVLVSSHNMLEIEYLSDRVAIIDKGIIHVTGTAPELKEKYGTQNLEEVFAEVVK
jgi:ABC-2 type transport system ATP-binding protein